ncbi:MAG: response regulator [Carnobacterium sp.]|nr:response regulator [Carnobacterium sp.]
MYKLAIIEDEHLIRKWLTYAVDYESLNIVIIGEAENGEEGIKLIKEKSPDIVITDINMPKKDAFQMFKETQEIDYKKIVISGYSDFENAQKAIHYSVEEFLSKPLELEELEKILSSLVSYIYIEKKNKKLIKIFSDINHTKVLPQTDDSVTNKVLLWIHTKYSEKFTIADIAIDIGYSESYIYKKVKDELGITINDYLNQYRIKMSVNMLISDYGLRIYEVAEMVGYSDYKYFNKVFKKIIGMTVSDFKDKLIRE